MNDGSEKTVSEWKTIDSAPHDGTLILLAITENHESVNPLEDCGTWRTIGFNDEELTGINEWHIAGWCWCHDHFTEGKVEDGEPDYWAPIPDLLEVS